MKVYLVEAYYDNYESSWSRCIGLFDNKEKADKSKQKWVSFYEENKSIFDEPENWEPNVDDDFECEWSESTEYYTLESKYDEIFEFRDIIINELIINDEIFLIDESKTYHMNDLLSQYNRDYKLKEIL